MSAFLFAALVVFGWFVLAIGLVLAVTFVGLLVTDHRRRSRLLAVARERDRVCARAVRDADEFVETQRRMAVWQ